MLSIIVINVGASDSLLKIKEENQGNKSNNFKEISRLLMKIEVVIIFLRDEICWILPFLFLLVLF